MAVKKKTKKKNSGSAKKSVSSGAARQKDFLKSEIGTILIIAGGVFLLLTDFGFMGGVGAAIRSVEKGLFGQAYFIFALFLIVFACLLYFERGQYLRKLKLLSLVIAFIAVTAIFDLMFAAQSLAAAGHSFTEYYALAAAGEKGGGAVGGAVASGLRSLVGYVGAYFFLIVILAISVVVMTEKSFVNAAKKGAERTIRTAKAGQIRHNEKKEERKKLREEERSTPKSIDLSAKGADPSAETETEMYLRYGREIIGNGQPGVDELKNVREPLRRRKPQAVAAMSEIGSETEVIGTLGREDREGVPVRVKQLNYDDDTVPFEETKEEKYKSYAGILSGTFSAESAGSAGYAAGRVIEPIIHDYSEPKVTLQETAARPEPEPEPTESVEPEPNEFVEPVSRTPTKASSVSAPSSASIAQASGESSLKPYAFPSSKLLSKGGSAYASGRDEILDNAGKLEQVLKNFGVGVTVTNIIRGPRVSRYELIPDTGVKVSRITALEGDIKLALAASELRIEAPVPGKSAVGIEVPNSDFRTVRFRDICESEEFKNARSPLSWGIGLDIQGLPVIGDIAKMPHVLVAGTTGSGKSVGINTLIMSILFKSTPEEVRLILIDPKVVELSVYNGIPHLLTDVVTKPDRALSALNWAVAEMNKRYRLFNESSTRNITGYNEKIERTISSLPEDYEGELPKTLPLILIIIDELSELMMHSKKDVEQAIVSLAQLARAAGIHLVVATQRPSVDVVTGLIKSNIPSRVAYRLPSAVDSRTILDQGGAETLLGNGDMLYKPGDKNSPERVQGAFLTDEEVEKVVAFVKKKNEQKEDKNQLDEDLNTQMEFDFSGFGASDSEGDPDRDEYFADAGRLIIQTGKASIGALQRKFKVGFNRASRIMDQLHDAGVVGDSEGTKERRILMSAEEFEAFLRGA